MTIIKLTNGDHIKVKDTTETEMLSELLYGGGFIKVKGVLLHNGRKIEEEQTIVINCNQVVLAY